MANASPLSKLQPVVAYSLPNPSFGNKDNDPQVLDTLSTIGDDELSEEGSSSAFSQATGVSEIGDTEELNDDGHSFEDSDWKRAGMTGSREPNERYNGGSKDSLFAERYGRAAFDMAASGGDGNDGDDGERNNSASGGSGGDEGSDGRRPTAYDEEEIEERGRKPKMFVAGRFHRSASWSPGQMDG